MSRAKGPNDEKQSRAARRRSREARRARFLLVGGALLSAVILGAWFPANALYHQRDSLTSVHAQLDQLHQQDAALAQERKDLSDSTEIARIAREQYQLVSPGQAAFEVLPPTGTVKVSSPYSGDPGLDGPVAPSSASVLPPGSATTSSAPVHAVRADGARRAPATPGAARRRGVLARMVDTLEFWN